MKVTPDNLDDVIKGILDEYADDINKHVTEATHKIAQSGAKAIKSSAQSKFKGTGKYAKGWTTRQEKHRLYAKETIHNKDRYQVAHLLEYDHLLRNGKRSKAVPHIKPVEEQIRRQYENAIVEAIK